MRGIVASKWLFRSFYTLVKCEEKKKNPIRYTARLAEVALLNFISILLKHKAYINYLLHDSEIIKEEGIN